MIKLRKSADRGHFNHGWLKTHHSFSFGDYYDPAHRGWRVMRVLNEDWVEPGEGFPTHAHNDMEIVTYVLSGALEHRDSMGNTSVIHAGDVQRMSAGTGVTHSEFNHSKGDAVHLFQVWFFPEKKHLTPEYEQKTFGLPVETEGLRRLVSPDGKGNSLSIHQDVRVYDARLAEGSKVSYPLANERGVWIQLADGILETGGVTLRPGDGLAVEQASSLELRCVQGAHFLLFDLA